MNIASTRALAIPGFFTWLIFPTLLAAVAGGSLALLSRPVPPPVVSVAVLLALIVVISGLERLFPQHRAWNRRPDPVDLALMVFNRLVDVGVIAGTLALVGGLQRAGVRLGLLHAWPTGAPLLVQALLGITLAEGIRYALHRASHHPGWLWRVHRIHHQPARMYALNGPRLHPANQLWVGMAHLVPMLLLGAALPAVILTANLTVFFVLLQHANLRLRFDGWNRVLATPDVHRLHHRKDAREDVNFGIVLLLFDRVFGTYRPAEEVAAGDIGLAENFPA
jgi:sterol desaturase/sphingolipid hydroxylase (fatty acid hydroxylase superfamily)